jgi:hypothetical protein
MIARLISGLGFVRRAGAGAGRVIGCFFFFSEFKNLVGTVINVRKLDWENKVPTDLHYGSEA